MNHVPVLQLFFLTTAKPFSSRSLLRNPLCQLSCCFPITCCVDHVSMSMNQESRQKTCGELLSTFFYFLLYQGVDDRARRMDAERRRFATEALVMAGQTASRSCSAFPTDSCPKTDGKLSPSMCQACKLTIAFR